MKTLMYARKLLMILMFVMGQMPTSMLAMGKSVQPQASSSAQSDSSAVASVGQPSSMQTGALVAPTPLVSASTVLPVVIASASTGTLHEATVNVSDSANSDNSSARADDGKEAKKSEAVLPNFSASSEIPFFPLLPEATMPADTFTFDVKPQALVDSLMSKPHTLLSRLTILDAAASSAQSSSVTEGPLLEEKVVRESAFPVRSAPAQMSMLPSPLSADQRSAITKTLELTQSAVSITADRAALERMSLFCKGVLSQCNPFADVDIEASLNATIKNINEKIRTLSQPSVASSSAAALSSSAVSSSASSSASTAASKSAAVSEVAVKTVCQASQKKAPLPVVQRALRKKLLEEYQKVSSANMNLRDLQTLSAWCEKNLTAFSFDQAPDIQQSLLGLKCTVDAKVASLQAVQKVIKQAAASSSVQAVQPPRPLLPSAEAATDSGAPVRRMAPEGLPIVVGSSAALSAPTGHCVASSSSALVSAGPSSDEKYGDETKVSLDQIRLRGVTSSLVPDSVVLEGLGECNGRYVGHGGMKKAIHDAILVEEFARFDAAVNGVVQESGCFPVLTAKQAKVTEKHVNQSKQRTKDAQKAACRWIDTKPAVWTSDDFRYWLGRTCLGMPNSLQLLVWFKQADAEPAKFLAPFKKHKKWYCNPNEFKNLLTDLGFRRHINSMGIMASSFVGWIPGIDIKDAALNDLIKTEQQQIENESKAARQQQVTEAQKQAELALRAQQERDAAAKKANEDERLKEERRKKAAAEAQAALEQHQKLAALEQERLRAAKEAQAAEAKRKAEQEERERKQKEETEKLEQEKQLRAREEIEERRKQARLDEENQKKRAAAEAAEEAERARIRAEKQKARELAQQKKEAFEASLEKVADVEVKAAKDAATNELLADLKRAREEEQQKKAAAEEAERKRLAAVAETKAFVKNIALNARLFHLADDAITAAKQEVCVEQEAARQEAQKIKEAEIEESRVKAAQEAKLAEEAENKRQAERAAEVALKENIKRAEAAFREEAARLQAQAEAANANARAVEEAKAAQAQAEKVVVQQHELAHVSELEAVQPNVDVSAEQLRMQQAALTGVTDRHEEKRVAPVQVVQQEQPSQPVQATVVAPVLPQVTGLLGAGLLPGGAILNDRRIKNAQLRATLRGPEKQVEDKQKEPKAAEPAASEKEAVERELAAKIAQAEAEKVAVEKKALAEQQVRELEARMVANEKVLIEQRMRQQAAAIDAKEERKNAATRYAVTSIKADIMLALRGNADAIARLNAWFAWVNRPSNVCECQPYDHSVDIAVIHAATSLLQPYAEQGSRIAQYFMALYYASAIMTNDNVDEEKSLSYFVRSATQEYIPSLERLALCLDKGIDTQAVTSRAQELWKQARVLVNNFRNPEESKWSHMVVEHRPFVPTLPIIVEANGEDCSRGDCPVLSNPLTHCSMSMAMSSSAVYSKLRSVATPIDSSEQKIMQAVETGRDAKEPKQPQAMVVVRAVAAPSQMDEATITLYNNVQAALNRGKKLREEARYGVALQYFKKAAEHSCGVPALQDLHEAAIKFIGNWYSHEATCKAQANDHQGEAQAGKDLVEYFLRLAGIGSQAALNYANRILSSIRISANDDRKQAVQVPVAVEASDVEQQIIERAKAAAQQAASCKDGKEAKEPVPTPVVVASSAKQLEDEVVVYDASIDNATRLIWRGVDYLEGTNGAVRDPARAFQFFERAELVSRGKPQHAQTLTILGECYLKGYGVRKNWGLAEEYYDQAAQEGYSDPAWILPNIR